MEELSQAKSTIQEILRNLGIEPNHYEERDKPIQFSTNIDFGRLTKTQTEEVKVRGWFQSIKFWSSWETRTYRKIDRNQLIKLMEDSLFQTTNSLRDHFAWWCGQITSMYLQPVEGQLNSEKDVLVALIKLDQGNKAEFETAKRAQNLLSILTGILSSYNGEISKDIPVTQSFQTHESKQSILGAQSSVIDHHSRSSQKYFYSFFADLFEISCEIHIQRTFGHFLKSQGSPKQILLLLGSKRSSHIKLATSLAHRRNGLESKLNELAADQWILFGPADIDKIPGAETIAWHLPYTLLIAPQDNTLKNCSEIENASRVVDAVGVEINANQINSG